MMAFMNNFRPQQPNPQMGLQGMMQRPPMTQGMPPQQPQQLSQQMRPQMPSPQPPQQGPGQMGGVNPQLMGGNTGMSGGMGPSPQMLQQLMMRRQQMMGQGPQG